MYRDKELYAKQEQIRLIDAILASLCSIELSNDGRKLLKKIKKRLSLEIIMLKNARMAGAKVNMEESKYSISNPV